MYSNCWLCYSRDPCYLSSFPLFLWIVAHNSHSWLVMRPPICTFSKRDNVDVQLQVSNLNHIKSGTWLATHYIRLSIVNLWDFCLLSLYCLVTLKFSLQLIDLKLFVTKTINWQEDHVKDNSDSNSYQHFQLWNYSWTSHKRPAKMSSLGGHIREVVTYESLANTGSKFGLRICEKSISKKNPVLVLSRNPARNSIMLQCLSIIQFQLAFLKASKAMFPDKTISQSTTLASLLFIPELVLLVACRKERAMFFFILFYS